MAQNSQRVIALVGAIVFFVSTISFTGLVVWQMLQEGREDTDDLSSLLEEEDGIRGEPLPDFEPVESVDELQVKDTLEGEGRKVRSLDEVIVVHYTLAGADNGLIIESSLSLGEPFETTLSELIPGWQEGVIGMKEGGSRRLLVPSDKAYQDGRDLVFDIELLEVKDPQTEENE